MFYSYCRVSTENQNLERQEYAIKEYCEKNNIKLDHEFSDKISGKTFDRKEYQEMKNILKNGDILIIKSLDRLGRNYDLIKEEWAYFLKNDIKIIVLDMPLISTYYQEENVTNSLMRKMIGNIVLELLAYVSENERQAISQRTKEALAVKKQQGVKLGKPTKLSDDDIKKFINLYNNNIKIIDLAKQFNLSYRYCLTMANNLGLEKRNKRSK